MKKYNSKEEAQTVADLMNKDQEPDDVFCPLAGNICRNDCVCFVKAWVTNRTKDEYAVEGFCCGNRMFKGGEPF